MHKSDKMQVCWIFFSSQDARLHRCLTSLIEKLLKKSSSLFAQDLPRNPEILPENVFFFSKILRGLLLKSVFSEILKGFLPKYGGSLPEIRRKVYQKSGEGFSSRIRRKFLPKSSKTCNILKFGEISCRTAEEISLEIQRRYLPKSEKITFTIQKFQEIWKDVK